MTLIKKNQSMFPSVWEDLFSNDIFHTPSMAQTGLSIPAVNIKETGDMFQIEMAAPGMKKADFNITVDQNVITISSEKSEENVEENKDEFYTRKEYSYHSFERSFTLPETADREKVKANYKEGVLIIEIPKKEEAKRLPQNIKVS